MRTIVLTKPFKFISLFAGIGGFDFGLKKVGGELVFASEIDKFAKKAFKELHGVEPQGDITKIDAKDVPDHDVIAAGFPCQSFSVAGNRGGFDDARGTLFFEVARIADEKKPKVLLLENVKGLVGHDKGKTLDTIVKTLNEIGYRVDFEVLNSKYFGVPQNRERIFIVAIREDLIVNEPWNIVDNNVVAKGKKRISGYDDVKTFNFDFPKNETVTKRLVDILEDNVDEKFYLDESKTNQLILNIKETDSDVKVVSNASRTGYNSHNIHDPEGIPPTIAARDYKGAKMVVEGLPIKEATKKGYAVANEGDAVNISFPSSNTRRGRVGKEGQSQTIEASGVNQGVVVPVLTPDRINKRQNGRRFKEDGDSSFTITTQDRHGVFNGLRIRKLTPKECWRLQGFTDEQHNAVEASGISNSQRYKQAGNAVTINVIEALGERLLPYL